MISVTPSLPAFPDRNTWPAPSFPVPFRSLPRAASQDGMVSTAEGLPRLTEGEMWSMIGGGGRGWFKKKRESGEKGLVRGYGETYDGKRVETAGLRCLC